MSIVRADEPTSAPIKVSHAGAATTVVVLAVPSYRLKIVSLLILVSTDLEVTIEDSDGTDLTGSLPISANNGFVLAPAEMGWFKTGVGKGIRIKTSAAGRVGGVIGYQAIP